MGGGGIRAPGENVFGAVPPAPEPPLDSPRPDDFSEFYAAHFHSLTVQLFAHTGDLSEAQDVVQEAFCRALARWSRLVSYDDPIAWVRLGALIGTNSCVALLQRPRASRPLRRLV